MTALPTILSTALSLLQNNYAEREAYRVMQLKSELCLMEFLRSSRCVAVQLFHPLQVQVGQFLQTFQSVHGRGHIQG